MTISTLVVLYLRGTRHVFVHVLGDGPLGARC